MQIAIVVTLANARFSQCVMISDRMRGQDEVNLTNSRICGGPAWALRVSTRMTVA
jgi:hypothetical protein